LLEYAGVLREKQGLASCPICILFWYLLWNVTYKKNEQKSSTFLNLN